MTSTITSSTATPTPVMVSQPLQQVVVQQQQQQLVNNGTTAGGLFPNASLYVGDLDPSVTETQLFDLFSQIGPVVSVRVCREQSIKVSLGYGYVNYQNSEHASNAMEALNFTPINGKPIRIMFSHRDPSIRKSGYANVYIKNLDSSIDNKALYDTFVAFGTVLSCKVATDSNGQSKGYGFVQFDQEEAAQNAIKRLDQMNMNDKKVSVCPYIRKQERDRARSPKFTNVYVKNLSENVTEDYLKKVFGAYGTTDSVFVAKDDKSGHSKGFGFVNFVSADAAASAIENLNGSSHFDKVWYVGRAQRKSEREAELRTKFEQERNVRYEKLQGANLYLKNLDDNVNDEKLKELFSEFGTITSCKVMLDPQGQSRGSGFVAFSSPEDATKAVTEMNGKMIGKKPLYVAVAQRKEERKARLQAQFAQIRTPGMAPVPFGVPGFHPGGPRLGLQQLYFGQGSPGSIPPQAAGYAFQQHILPGLRPGIAPNYMMPYHLQRQGQHGQRMGLRRGGAPQQMQQQQFMQRSANQGFRYMSSARNGLDPSIVPQGLVGPMMPLPPQNVSGMPVAPIDVQRSGPVPITTLSSALASASPEQQHQMLGEQLFPLVDQLEHELAGKITGMLLEMDQTEVLHLIESPDALKKKVDEALHVLQVTSGPDAADQHNS
ncbi:Polyadenylate-binding protein [Thalictrum thalictroides]|uniref:Polyadenylate-binding protein n=1 Tax=Thalictrum thalictroides TaxID=46969 RepID=A0A7J6VWG7_THATH|nr:Polyadenylate-binding protein [Thalictrum thalictroides]